MLLICFILTGCAGLADYTISLENGYRIDRLSAHQIAIYGEEPVQSEDKSVYNYLYVPTEVSDVWWNEDYIVAKQIVLVADERGYEQPPKKPTSNDFYYWLIDVNNHQVLGPLNEKEFHDETSKLELTEVINLKPVEKLK